MADILGFIWSGEGDQSFGLLDPVVGNLEFDCIDAETHDWSRDVTSNPVENGSPIADHIIEQPDKLSVTGMISNSPIRSYSDQILGIVNGQINDDRVVKAFDTLDRLMKSKELVTIYTRYKTYTDMVLQSVNIPRTVEAGDAIIFTVQAIKVRIVTSQTTSLPKGLGVKKTGKDAGKSNSKNVDTAKRGGTDKNNGKSTADIQRSTAKSLLNYFKG